MIPVERKRRSSLCCTFDDHPYNIFDRDHTLTDSFIKDTVQIFFGPLCSIAVLQCIAFDCEYLMGAHQVPVAFNIVSCLFPEIVGIADGREHIVGFHPLISVVCPETKKFGKVSVPDVQVNGHGTLPHSKLVYGHSRIICEPYPADYTSCGSLKSTD